MSKKFISVENEKVMFIHYMPLDPVNGLGKTENELSEMGYLVDDVPDPEIIEGKIPVLYYNTENGLWYEYIDAPIYNGTDVNVIQQIQDDTINSLIELGVL